MAREFITPNWHAINKAIAAEDGSRWDPIRELDKLKEKIREKINTMDRERAAKRKADNRAAVRALPVGSPVKYIGSETFKRGEDGKMKAYGFAGSNGITTARAGRKWIGVDFGPTVGRWSILLDNLAPGHHEEAIAAQHREQATTQRRIGDILGNRLG